LFWSNGGNVFPDAPTVVINVTIDPKEPAGQYTNIVTGTSDCGSFAGEDLLPVTTGPPANQGNNPGIIVPRPPVVTAPNNSGTQAATTSRLPFTSTAAPDTSIWLGVILLGLVISAVAATRVLREGPID
jgi:hypothetical protein